jgi:AdoMet-dependent rRNA methyltransferase SPB1
LSSTVLPTFPAHNSNDAATSTVVTNPGATAAVASVNIFAPEKKKRNRAGYADNDYTLYREVPVQTFIHSNLADAATILGSYNKMAFDKSDPQVQRWLESRHTTDEVLRNVDDLKVLGKSDFKRLLKWRTAIRLEVSAFCGDTHAFEDGEQIIVSCFRSVSTSRRRIPRML